MSYTVPMFGGTDGMPLDAHLNRDEPVLESKSPDPDRFLARGTLKHPSRRQAQFD